MKKNTIDMLIRTPLSHIAERSYIISVLIGEFLGLDFEVKSEERQDVSIRFDGDAEMILADTFFSKSASLWLHLDSLPEQPLKKMDLARVELTGVVVKEEVSVIFGEEETISGFYYTEDQRIYLGLDVFGSAFFMLSRYEEAVKSERDNHDRFPATASLAYQEGFLDRPIVNEYLDILWVCMKKLWPRLERKKRTPRTLISCDVDFPYSAGIKSLKKQIRQTGGDLFKRKDLKRTLCGVANYFNAKRGDFSLDVNYRAFDWMMDVNEAAGNKVAFYFMAGQTDSKMDGDYTLDEPVIQRLMQRIHERGHEIGLHTSYNTYLDPQQTVREADRLRQAMVQMGIHQDELGGRQHYLRWQTPQTARSLAEAGMDYDSTLTFADHIGFRCGVCYEYPMYDLRGRKPLTLRQRPLVVMEGSLFEKNYMGLNCDEKASEFIMQFKSCCHEYDGDFTLLWHNSNLGNLKDKSIYREGLHVFTM